MLRLSASWSSALSAVLMAACGGPFGDGVFTPLPDPGEPGGVMAAGGGAGGIGEAGGAGGMPEAGGAGGVFVPPPEPPPGPVCLYNGNCADDEYCHRRFGTCFGVGTCQPRPVACDPAEDAPVCDCLGLPQTSPCAAAMAGRNIGYPGACGRECTQRADCAADEVCRLLPDFGAGALGTCGAPPTDCGEDNPVCRNNRGDGNARNECDAAMNDDWLSGPGPCGACTTDIQCRTGLDDPSVREVCVLPAGRCGEAVLGECQTIDDYDRCAWQIANGDAEAVCTCSGQTLAAACEADWRSRQVDHLGACEAGP